MSEALRFGVIGQNISYSKSKDIFEILFDRAGLKGQFGIISIEPEAFETTLERLVDEGFGGLSVTIPFKETILNLLDTIDPVASQIGAVNSVLIDNGRLSGMNTDCFGITESLKLANALDSSDRVLILGCGGAARAAVFSLVHNLNVANIVVVGRSKNRLSSFEETISHFSAGASIRTESYDTLLTGSTNRFSVVINCTPLGGWNLADKSPLPIAFDWSQTEAYFDMNYNADNAVVKSALDAGRTAVDGSAMLVAQAVKSFETWTGHKSDWRSVHKELF